MLIIILLIAVFVAVYSIHEEQKKRKQEAAQQEKERMVREMTIKWETHPLFRALFDKIISEIDKGCAAIHVDAIGIKVNNFSYGHIPLNWADDTLYEHKYKDYGYENLSENEVESFIYCLCNSLNKRYSSSTPQYTCYGGRAHGEIKKAPAPEKPLKPIW